AQCLYQEMHGQRQLRAARAEKRKEDVGAATQAAIAPNDQRLTACTAGRSSGFTANVRSCPRRSASIVTLRLMRSPLSRRTRSSTPVIGIPSTRTIVSRL